MNIRLNFFKFLVIFQNKDRKHHNKYRRTKLLSDSCLDTWYHSVVAVIFIILFKQFERFLHLLFIRFEIIAEIIVQEKKCFENTYSTVSSLILLSFHLFTSCSYYKHFINERKIKLSYITEQKQNREGI